MNYHFEFVNCSHYDSIKEYRKELLDCGSKFDGCSNLQNYENIEKWDLNNKLFEKTDTLPPGYSIAYQYLYMCNDDVVGMVSFRPLALSHQALKQYGGHIGYNIRPRYRKQGIGTKMLKEFLIICKNDYKINKILITCLENNEGSKRIIIKNGGVFEKKIPCPGEKELLERYWIEL